MGIFIVSQNKTFDKEPNGGYVWAPNDDSYGHVSVSKIKKDDYILHLKDGYIFAIGIANGSYEVAEGSGSPGQVGYKVKVEYHFFDSNKSFDGTGCLNLDEAGSNHRAYLANNWLKFCHFTHTGDTHQCYMTYLTRSQAAYLLEELCKINTGDREVDKILKSAKDYVDNAPDTDFLPDAYPGPGEKKLEGKNKGKAKGGEVEVTDHKKDEPLNQILYGAPGTGKTYSTRRRALDLLGESYDAEDEEYIKKRFNELREKQIVKVDSDKQTGSKDTEKLTDNEEPAEQKVEEWEPRIQFVTFHQSYGYEEFIEGIRPSTENGIVTYDTKDGVFKRFCNTARKDKDNKYVFIIDEINRGNISKIFGELITLIEDNKRECGDDPASAILPYSGDTFSVPSNVYILGTMNTADRSITSIDTALRRRFYFEEMPPEPKQLEGIAVDGIEIQKMFIMMNERIEVLYDREHCIGHAYFLSLKKDPSIVNLANIFKMRIIPLLQEYFYNDYEKIRCVLGDDTYGEDPSEENRKRQFITVERVEAPLLGQFSSGNDYIYKINKEALDNPEAYKKIYS